ncbi:MAG: cell division protein FtsL [Pseudomonadota bacterium]|nr:cell division protein FtsL [Pseudomonadota bacterium]
MTTANQQTANRQEKVTPVQRWLGLFVPANLLAMGLATAVLLTALAVVVYTFESRTVFFALQEERDLYNRLDVEWGQLLIEQSTFALESRIEQVAVEQLGMKVPDWSQIVVVQDRSLNEVDDE